MSNKLNKFQIFLSVLISLFFVIFIWWFFSKWIFALWFNVTVFWLLLFWLLLSWIKEKQYFCIKNFYWIIPLLFIILSFSIYENVFIKFINVFILPFLFIFFSFLSISKIDWSKSWNILLIIKGILGIEISPKKVSWEVLDVFDYWIDNKIILKKVWKWLLIFAILNLFIVSLLSKADSNFSSKVSVILDWLSIKKILMFSFLFILLISIKLFWQKEHILKNEESTKTMDSIVSGIVLGWTLFIYLIFIYSQFENIFVDNLPSRVEDVADLVKSWFWQLFFVSIINIIFFFIYYGKTSKSVQNILVAFVFASIIILISAWVRMFLYVYDYWFSHEKFFASYTVLYFWILFILMIFFLFLKNKFDILKVSIVLALWMYAWLNAFPVEKIIFEVNLAITQRGDSHIQKYQSHMLSTDIFSSVKDLQFRDKNTFASQNWDEWLKNRVVEYNYSNKKREWYERNINNLLIK